MASLRLIFAGSGSFGATVLTALCKQGHDIAAVLSQPDRPAGRKLRPKPTAVSQAARAADQLLLQPAALDENTHEQLLASQADV